MRYKGKCSGACCQRIVLPRFNQQDLRECYLAWLNGAAEFTGPSGTFPVILDIFLLYPMLQPVGWDELNRQVFACKNYIKETGLCSIYEIRPAMCRQYPNGVKCSCEGCTVEPE